MTGACAGCSGCYEAWEGDGGWSGVCTGLDVVLVLVLVEVVVRFGFFFFFFFFLFGLVLGWFWFWSRGVSKMICIFFGALEGFFPCSFLCGISFYVRLTYFLSWWFICWCFCKNDGFFL